MMTEAKTDGVRNAGTQNTSRAAPPRPNRLRRKNLVLMALLVGWVVIIYLVAIVRLGGGQA